MTRNIFNELSHQIILKSLSFLLITAPEPVLECTNSEIIARFSLEREPRLRPEYLSLQDNTNPSCGFRRETQAGSVNIIIPYAGCGTTKEKVITLKLNKIS